MLLTLSWNLGDNFVFSHFESSYTLKKFKINQNQRYSIQKLLRKLTKWKGVLAILDSTTTEIKSDFYSCGKNNNLWFVMELNLSWYSTSTHLAIQVKKTARLICTHYLTQVRIKNRSCRKQNYNPMYLVKEKNMAC